MKTPILLCAAILFAGGIVGWRDHQHLLAVRATHDAVVAEAAKRGISNNHPIRVTKRKREDIEAAARQCAADYIRFIKLRNQSSEDGESDERKQMEFDARLKSLDAGQWEILLIELCTSDELMNGARQGILYNLITSFADAHPQAALEFLSDHGDLVQDARAKHLIGTALSAWSRDQPLAALEWVRGNGADYPGLITEETKRRMVIAAATQDPQTAFTLVRGLDAGDFTVMMGEMIGIANTPEKRTATLVAFRGYLAGFTDQESRKITETIGIMALAGSVIQEGYDNASQWVVSAGLTPHEIERFSVGLSGLLGSSGDSGLNESGQWIEWIGANLPAGKGSGQIQTLVSNWTQRDFQAAAKWLGTLPDGSVRNLSVRAFAQTVAPIDPESAVQWAMTLPAGKDREQTLHTIYTNWPKNDPAGKQAFAMEHGIK